MAGQQGNDTDTELKWFEIPGWCWAFDNIVIWLMPSLLAFGILFNLLCFITIYRGRSIFPKISRLNMMIITASDIVVLSVSGTYYHHKFWVLKFAPTKLDNTFMGRQHDSVAACHFINYFQKFLLNGAPFFLVALTTERVLAVVLPLKGYVDGKCDDHPNFEFLLKIDPIHYHIDFYMSTMGLFIYLLAASVSVGVTLILQQRNVAKLSAGVDKAKQKKLVTACIVMIFMNFTFFFSHGPRAGLSLLEGYFYKIIGTQVLPEAQLDMYYNIFHAVQFLHNVLDPFVYFIGHGFRQAFMDTLMLGLPGRKATKTNDTNSAISLPTSTGLKPEA
uniref:G_PROTEIN_RECEP_F1_2 domain-containing protein n=1 Tax=Macrostomum lignano TaxID=282301 RepID=A0A1I8HFK9_9PLAT